LYEKRGIDLSGLQRTAGKTFHWSGEYEVNMNERCTLKTELGVFETFSPELPRAYRRTPYVLLANIAPDLQHHVLDQMERPKFVVADTMDLWLNIALKSLLKLLRRVDLFVLNDSEARQLTGEDNVVVALKKIHHFGPTYVIVKKGEHGSILSGPDGLFVAPAYPLQKLVDPTGAGDSFVGGMIGYLAAEKGALPKKLRRAILHGSVVASLCCEGFGLTRTVKVTRAQIRSRVRELERMAKV
jgi:sugar/nucleoside kinase (ribokinase family)